MSMPQAKQGSESDRLLVPERRKDRTTCRMCGPYVIGVSMLILAAAVAYVTLVLRRRQQDVWQRRLNLALPPVLYENGVVASPTAAETIFITLTFQSDKLPLHVMLPHQLRMLTNSPQRISEVVVLDNRPPWLKDRSSPQDADLLQLKEKGAGKVVPVDYALWDDLKFTERFFRTAKPATLRALQEPYRQSLMDGMPFEYAVSNFFGEVAALAQCLDAKPSIEICVYFDPDIFLNRGEQGLLDIAPQVFKEHPKLVSLQPPNGCQFSDSPHDSSTVCKTEPTAWQSGRYWIVNRTRLSAMLPLVVEPTVFSATFERMWSDVLTATRKGSLGQMDCAAESFAMHPPSRFLPASAMTLPDLLATLVQDEKFLSPKEQTHKGAARLAERIEAGRFKANSMGNHCEDMIADKPRILNEGSAFSETSTSAQLH